MLEVNCHTVTLGFFDDIYIPAENLQKNSRFDETEHAWVWEYESEDGNHDLFMDTGIILNLWICSLKMRCFVPLGEEIRFKVVAEDFTDTTPSGPSNETHDPSLDPSDNKKMAYRITVR